VVKYKTNERKKKLSTEGGKKSEKVKKLAFPFFIIRCGIKRNPRKLNRTRENIDI